MFDTNAVSLAAPRTFALTPSSSAASLYDSRTTVPSGVVCVVGRPDESGLTIAVAHVVPAEAEGSEDLAEALTAHLKERLAPHLYPRLYEWHAELPRNDRGKIARKLLARKLGFRNLLDVIPLDTSLVRGSHGRVNQALGWDPVLISEATVNMQEDSDGRIPCTAVRDLLLEMLFA